MTWTSATPTQPGWYWWRASGQSRVKIVLVEDGPTGLEAWTLHAEPMTDGYRAEVASVSTSVGGAWCGPLEPPA